MKTFKEHSTYFNLPVLTEEEFEDLILLISEAYDPEGYYDRVKKHLGEQLGPLLGKGSSRAAHAGGDITIPLREYDRLKERNRYITDKDLIALIDKLEFFIKELRKHIVRTDI